MIRELYHWRNKQTNKKCKERSKEELDGTREASMGGNTGGPEARSETLFFNPNLKENN